MNYEDLVCDDNDMDIDDADWDLVNDENPIRSVSQQQGITAKELTYSQATMQTLREDSTDVEMTNTSSDIKNTIIAIGKDGSSQQIHLESWLGDESDDEEDARHHFKPGQLIGTPISELKHSKREGINVDVLKRNINTLPPSHNQLLVDKYRPTRFTDLTSSETINLKVLEWMKEWDDCVFPKKKIEKNNNNNNIPLTKMDKILNKEEAEKDPRPETKIILISGPPGAGKTTLATVIAHHCGYESMQVNASMDRTASSIDQKINVVATGSGTLIKKPYCLILDEIDGIASSAQGVLSKLIKLTEVSWKERNKKQCQLRPVICICNDPWVRELRGLRTVADHIKIENIATEKLASRLKTICYNEKINADTMALKELCSISNGDIRSCLFTLQFLSRRHTKLGVSEITGSGDGLKDRVPHWTEVMRGIFGTDEALAAKKLQNIPNLRFGGRKAVAYVRQLTSGHPDVDKIFDACFEVYPELKYPDYDLKKTSRLLRGVSGADSHSNGGAGYADMSQVVLLFHITCQSTLLSKKNWQFPKIRSENYKKTLQSKEIIEHHIGPRRSHMSVNTFALDVISSFLAILQPANIKLQKSFLTQEHSDEFRFATLCCLHDAYNVTYRKIDKKRDNFSSFMNKVDDRDYTVEMVPNLTAVTFNNKYKKYRFLPLETKLRIATGIKNLKMLSAVRKESKNGAEEHRGEHLANRFVEFRKSQPTTEEKKEHSLPEHIRNATLQKKPLPSASVVVSRKRDLFGNFLPDKDDNLLKGSKSLSRPADTKKGLQGHRMFDPSIGCKYEQNSGFTNAVKRRCHWADWL